MKITETAVWVPAGGHRIAGILNTPELTEGEKISRRCLHPSGQQLQGTDGGDLCEKAGGKRLYHDCL